MKNREKFEKEILNIACNGGTIAIDMNGNLVDCNVLSCDECIFWKDCLCNQEELVSKWCNAEYVEKPKISENDRRFLDYIPNKEAWMTRDVNGHLYLFCEIKPQKTNVSWNNKTASYVWLNALLNVDFPMIKWEDEEPWAIEDLKKLEVRKK